MTTADQITQLELHAENLKACRSFEDYQRCHVAWIDLLVLEHKAKLAKEQAMREFVDKTEFVTKIQDAAGKITETNVKTQRQVSGRPEDIPDRLTAGIQWSTETLPCVNCGSPVVSTGDTCGNCGTIRTEPIAADDARTDPVQDDRAKRRAADLTPSQQAKLDLAKGQSDTIKGKIK